MQGCFYLMFSNAHVRPFAAVPFRSLPHAPAAPRGGTRCAVQPQTALSRLVWDYWDDVSSRHFTGTRLPRRDIACGPVPTKLWPLSGREVCGGICSTAGQPSSSTTRRWKGL